MSDDSLTIRFTADPSAQKAMNPTPSQGNSDVSAVRDPVVKPAHEVEAELVKKREANDARREEIDVFKNLEKNRLLKKNAAEEEGKEGNTSLFSKAKSFVGEQVQGVVDAASSSGVSAKTLVALGTAGAAAASSLYLFKKYVDFSSDSLQNLLAKGSNLSGAVAGVQGQNQVNLFRQDMRQVQEQEQYLVRLAKSQGESTEILNEIYYNFAKPLYPLLVEGSEAMVTILKVVEIAQAVLADTGGPILSGLASFADMATFGGFSAIGEGVSSLTQMVDRIHAVMVKATRKEVDPNKAVDDFFNSSKTSQNFGVTTGQQDAGRSMPSGGVGTW